MGRLRTAIRLGLRRRRYYYRSLRKSRDLQPVHLRTDTIHPSDILLVCTLRDERVRLPWFLGYYRRLGIDHFLFVDNGSEDGSREYLARQPDCSVWTTRASYKIARFGQDWVNYLGRRYACGHWMLCVDVDEFLVYPFCDTRPIRALTDWLDGAEIKSFGALMLDMYPKGRIAAQPYVEGQDPLEIAAWFDAGNYTITRNWFYNNIWIQGGPRARVFFADRPRHAPALNKIPLMRWRRGTVYVSSTHSALPRGLNLTFDDLGGEKTCGCLLHTKFLDTLAHKAGEEMERGQHYGGSREYRAYRDGLADDPDLWCKWSERYINWRQLEILGLMSKGNWA